PQLRVAVVTAVEALQPRRQPHIGHPGHLADMCVEIHRLEGAGRKPAALRTQRLQSRLEAAADAARRGELAQDEGTHGARGSRLGGVSAARKVMGVSSAAATESRSRGNTSRITGTPLPVSAACPSCSNRMSPAPRSRVSLPKTASALALTVSKPRRVQLARRRPSRLNTGSRNGLRNPAGARKKRGCCPV